MIPASSMRRLARRDQVSYVHFLQTSFRFNPFGIRGETFVRILGNIPDNLLPLQPR